MFLNTVKMFCKNCLVIIYVSIAVEEMAYIFKTVS